MFDYDPANDNLLPCEDIGLSFFKGDILEVSHFFFDQELGQVILKVALLFFLENYIGILSVDCLHLQKDGVLYIFFFLETDCQLV